jgi:hypothetical protein
MSEFDVMGLNGYRLMFAEATRGEVSTLFKIGTSYMAERPTRRASIQAVTTMTALKACWM